RSQYIDLYSFQSHNTLKSIKISETYIKEFVNLNTYEPFCLAAKTYDDTIHIVNILTQEIKCKFQSELIIKFLHLKNYENSNNLLLTLNGIDEYVINIWDMKNQKQVSQNKINITPLISVAYLDTYFEG